MRIWGSGDGTCFATEDEKRAYTLLTTFNGLYQVYSRAYLSSHVRFET